VMVTMISHLRISTFSTRIRLLQSPRSSSNNVIVGSNNTKGCDFRRYITRVPTQISNRYQSTLLNNRSGSSRTTTRYIQLLPTRPSSITTGNKINLRRNLSTSSSTKPPELSIASSEGNTILQQKAQKAAQLHAELNVLLEQQAQRRADEVNQPFGASFIRFIKRSKSELINIFAAFTCVLLAWQIATMRAGARKLLNQSEEREVKVEDLKELLRIINSKDFQSNVVERYVQEKKNRHDNTNRFSWMRANQTTDGKETSEEELLTKTLGESLEGLIKDAALTDLEIEEKKLRMFQLEMGIFDQQKGVKSSQNEIHDDDKSTLMNQIPMKELMEENSVEVSDDNRTVVKRSKGFI